MTLGSPAWTDVPARTVDRRPLGWVVIWAAAVLPVLAQELHRGTSGGRLLLVASAAGAVVLAAGSSPWRLIGPLAGLAGLAVASGPGAAALYTVLAASWAIAGRGVLRIDGRSVRVRGVLVPVAMADVLLILSEGTLLPWILASLALVGLALGAVRPDLAERILHAQERVGRAAAAAVGVVAMLPAAGVVLLGWAARRLVGLDPLRHGSAGWVSRQGDDPYPERMYAQLGASSAPQPFSHRVRRRVGNVAVLTALALVPIWVVWGDPPEAPYSPAFDDEPQFGEVWAEQQGFSRHPRFDPVTVFQYADYRSEHTNQVDGLRRTWSPPPCECQRHRVWWFGGSTAWGFYQSDMDSLPSQVAKAAWRRGVALDIENRAQPGYTLTQEVHEFASLTAHESAPDLVVFYDGANEIDFQIDRNNAGKGADESPIAFSENVFDVIYSTVERVFSLAPSRTAGTVRDEEGPDSALDGDQLATHLMNRYRRGVDLATRIAASVGTEVVFAWQPTQITAPDEVSAPFEPVTPWRPPDLQWFQRLTASARAQLPPQVIDLSDVFDGRDQPLMPDFAHTNTDGARIAGSELARHLETVLAGDDQ